MNVEDFREGVFVENIFIFNPNSQLKQKQTFSINCQLTKLIVINTINFFNKMGARGK
jgi:ribosomal protein S16